MKLGILGATGWLGQALGLRLMTEGLWPEADLVLANRASSRAAYDAHPGVTWSDAGGISASCDITVLAQRPEDFPAPGLDPQGRAGQGLVISFMTVWTLEKLRAVFPRARIVRAMPNGAAPVGRSYTPWVAEALSAEEAALVGRLLSALGPQDRVQGEDQLDYLAALSGSGSAYPALMGQAMLEDALARGLPRGVALRAVEAVLCGSAPFLEGRIDQLEALLESYRAYRGVTAAGLEAAEPGLSHSVRAALAAATQKARDLGK